MRFLTATAAIVLALLPPCLAARPAGAAPLRALSSTDAQAYGAAFDAAERGDFDTADQAVAKVADPCLVGEIQYMKITRAKAHPGDFDQLVSWLKSFGDLPGADKIYALAMKLRPAGGPPPPAPTAPPVALADDGDARTGAAPQSEPARQAYFGGDVTRALALAHASGDAWIAGLANWRLGRYADALASFQTIADNPAEGEGSRSAGAFWAARAASAANLPDQATRFLKVAAGAPDTFYGMIAGRELALSDDPMDNLIAVATKADSQPALPSEAMFTLADFSGGEDGLAAFVAADPRARRAVALAQIGRPIDAGAELRAGFAEATDENSKSLWMRLMFALNPGSSGNGEIQLHSNVAAAQNAFYPTPALNPQGGFTVDKALVYAVVWQESRFNSLAVSRVGAVGLMQLMPPSAAGVAGDFSLTADPIPLFDTGRNLQLGQAYLSQLLGNATGYDMLRAIAAYNAGPGTVSRTEALLGSDIDSLTLMESLPYAETRAYVRKVMAAYWAYRRQFGASTRTLDAAASGQRLIDARLDQSSPSQDGKPANAEGARQALEILLRRAG